jgi:hypothetical protein
MEESYSRIAEPPMREPVTFALVETGEALRRAWPHVRDFIASALEHSMQHEWTPEQIFEKCERGQFKLALVLRHGSCIGAQVFDHGVDPKGERFVSIVCSGGFDMDQWIGGMVALGKKLAELAGADKVVVVGRRGWGAVLRAYGLETRAIIAYAPVGRIATPVDFADLVISL